MKSYSILSKLTGNLGENIATNYCVSKLNYTILNRNYKCAKLGEIDIVCKKENTIIFVEVKTRASNKFMDIFDVVDNRKMVALKRAAQFYILKFNLENFQHRIDLITINNQTNEIDYFENITSSI